ncbi:hypothetical protein B0H14DRAFT_3906203 [Mycena olivaceomarginata]|nr:hypothetical protein B0H14DRAFT_3906203 [Mycena olivaceomarginata]
MDYPACTAHYCTAKSSGHAIWSTISVFNVFNKIAACRLEQPEIEKAIATAEDEDSDDRSGHTATSPLASNSELYSDICGSCPSSCSSYFHTALVSWPASARLPLTGTLTFSHRTYDLATALALHAEVRACIVSEMAHGLFHALLPFSAYRVPRILEFSLHPNVLDPILKRSTRRALVGLFGTRRCTPELAGLPTKLHSSALKGLEKRSTPVNALAVLWAAKGALTRLNGMVDVRLLSNLVRILTTPRTEAGRAQVDAVMAGQTAEVLAEADFTSIMSADSVRFEDGERVEWAVPVIVRGVKEENAERVYQALVNVLLLPHHDPDEPGSFPAQPLLSPTSHVRVQATASAAGP